MDNVPWYGLYPAKLRADAIEGASRHAGRDDHRSVGEIRRRARRDDSLLPAPRPRRGAGEAAGRPEALFEFRRRAHPLHSARAAARLLPGGSEAPSGAFERPPPPRDAPDRRAQVQIARDARGAAERHATAAAAL